MGQHMAMCHVSPPPYSSSVQAQIAQFRRATKHHKSVNHALSYQSSYIQTRTNAIPTPHKSGYGKDLGRFAGIFPALDTLNAAACQLFKL
ncbi:hypothetical protein CFIMG_008537RA00001 [Ceratocystis fimbriata CBS 114723]|uniref:Uncharacterized protein n=1 Tax=Ceratocystis fimbriata CBS 114723 TaxID=1035309 RepID=A0A2C5X158_9PEZI|nr:hypothetical protein CFIMG_008537RA00001 [Ceratocystis fimbriata CBS 114723]